MNLERKSSLLIVAACLLWAMDLLVRYPVSLKMNFISIVFLESLTGLLFVSPWLFKNFKTLMALKKRDWLITLFIGGIGMTVAGYLQTVSIQKATPGLFSFFQIFQPLFVIYMAHLLLKEKVDNMYLYWGIWVILSAVLMFSVDLQLMFASDFILTDMLIALSTMLIWGLCTILGKKFLMRHSALTLVSLRWVFAFIFSGLILLMEDESVPMEIIFQTDIALRFIFMGAIAGILSMSLYYKGLQELPAGKVSFLEISYAAFGMIFSAIYTFESLNFFQILGATSFFAFIILFLSRQESGPSSVKTGKLSPVSKF
ncbi:MAG: DMT family transporter [Bacteriovoracia bacterium]